MSNALDDLLELVADISSSAPPAAPAPGPAPPPHPHYHSPPPHHHGHGPPHGRPHWQSGPPQHRPRHPAPPPVEFDFPNDAPSSAEWAIRTVRRLEEKGHLPKDEIAPDSLGGLHQADPAQAEEVVRGFIRRVTSPSDHIQRPAAYFASIVRSKRQECHLPRQPMGGGLPPHFAHGGAGGPSAAPVPAAPSTVTPPTVVEANPDAVVPRSDIARTPSSAMRENSPPPLRPATWPEALRAPVMAPGRLVVTEYTEEAAAAGSLVDDDSSGGGGAGAAYIPADGLAEAEEGGTYGAGLFAGDRGAAGVATLEKLMGLPASTEEAQLMPLCTAAIAFRSAQLRAQHAGAALAAVSGDSAGGGVVSGVEESEGVVKAKTAVANAMASLALSWPQRDMDAQLMLACLTTGFATAAPALVPPPSSVDLIAKGRAMMESGGGVGAVSAEAARAAGPSLATSAVSAANAFDAAAAWGVRFSTIVVVTDVPYEAAALARTLGIVCTAAGVPCVHVSESKASNTPPFPLPTGQLLQGHGQFNESYTSPSVDALVDTIQRLKVVPVVVVGDCESLQSHSLTREGYTLFGPHAVSSVILRAGVHSNFYQIPSEQPCPSGIDAARKRREGDEGAVAHGALISFLRRCVPFGAPRAVFMRYDNSPLAFTRLAPFFCGGYDVNGPTSTLVTRTATSSLLFCPLSRRPLRGVFNLDTTIAAPPDWAGYRALWAQRDTQKRLVTDTTALMKARGVGASQDVDTSAGVDGPMPEWNVVKITPSEPADIPADAPADDRWSDIYLGTLSDEVESSSLYRHLLLLGAPQRAPLNPRLTLGEARKESVRLPAAEIDQQIKRADPAAATSVIHLCRFPPSLVDDPTPTLTILGAVDKKTDVLAIAVFPPEPAKATHAMVRFRNVEAARRTAPLLQKKLQCETQFLTLRASDSHSAALPPPPSFVVRLRPSEAAKVAAASLKA